MSVFEYSTQKRKPPRRRKFLKMHNSIYTFKLFHLRVSVVMLQLFRQSFDSHDDMCVFNNECVKVSE